MNARLAAGFCAVLCCPGIAAGDVGAQRPPGFQRVLWVDAAGAADAALLARVREAGFDAINLGPSGDPAPLRAAGLGFYLDQPVGKGFLELRDAEFEPLRTDYERTRDPAGLLRPQCLRDPARLQDLGARAAAAAARLRGPELRFVALADEASATRHNNPLDLCRCEICLKAFRAFLSKEYADIQGLDAAWGTDFADFDQVVPLTTDQVRRRELGGVLLPGNLRPFSDWLRFVDQGFAAAVAHLHEQVRRTVPDVPVGLTGLQPPVAFGGHDYALLLPPLSLVEPYDIGAAPALARSWLPRAEHWFTLTVPAGDAVPTEPGFEAMATARLCAAAANGSAGVVVWNHAAMFAGDTASPHGKALQRALSRLRVPLEACAGGAVRAADVWIVESQPSVRAWWMLDSAADGMTWVRRLASHEATHSTSLAARRAWVELLSDLGIRAQFVASEQMPERLLQQRPRLLVLPATIALADRACRAIAAYVQQGGTVLADHSAALYDDGLRLRPAGGLDALFGITARSLRWEDLLVKEGRGAGEGVAESGLRAELAERSGDEPVFLERRHGRGRAVYLNLAVCDYSAQRLDVAAVRSAVELRRRVRQVLAAVELAPPFDVRGDGLPTCLERTQLLARDGRHILAVRIDALAAPQLLARLLRGGPRSVRLTFPRPVQLRSLSGQDLGSGTEFEAQLDPCAGMFLVQQ